MKLSNYNIIHPKGDRYVVFNTFTTSLAVLTENEFQQLQTLSGDSLSTYRELGFLIDDDVDELAIMRFDNAYFAATSACHFRILTTTACNARCTYCYEHGVSIGTMNQETVARTVAFIKNTVPAGQPVQIEWFGGEPLVNMTAILQISRSLTAEGYPITSSMVTNGILLDQNKITLLKEVCGLEKVQITLDGPADTYSAVKGVPADSFYRVIRNIRLLSDMEITVHVRMNYAENKSELKKLILYLGDTLGARKGIYYYIYPIFEQCTSVPREIMMHILELNDELLATGLMKKQDMYQFTYRQTRCFATNHHGYTIAPDGRLYNCTHVLNERGAVGSIDSYSPYHPNRIRFTDQQLSERCAACVFYPLCKGGCRAAELGEAALNQCMLYKTCFDLVLDKVLELENPQ